MSAFGLKCFQDVPGAQEKEGDCGGQVYCAKFSMNGNIYNMTGKGCGNATDDFSERSPFVHHRFNEMFQKILARVDKLE